MLQQDAGESLETADELPLRLHQQTLIAEFGLFALREQDLSAVLDRACVCAAEGLATRFAKVLRFLPGEREFLLQSGVGWNPGTVGHARVGADLESPAGFAFHTALPVISNHLADEKRFRTPQLLLDHGILSAFNVIVRDGAAEPYGVLEADSTHRGEFSSRDVPFLQALANTLAAAIGNTARKSALEDSARAKDVLLREKEILVQEVHHRVKNSLQLVQTLLHLQARRIEDSAAQQQLHEAATRVMTIGEVHKRLYLGSSMADADAAVYLSGLLEDLQASLSESVDGRPVRLEATSFMLPADHLTPLGLITTELVTNAIKYGTGAVVVRVDRRDRSVEVAVEDEGPGFPANFAHSGGPGLGMRLVTALAKGGEAAVRVDRSAPGGRIEVTLTVDPL